MARFTLAPVLLAALAFLQAGPVAAEIYRWTDADGTVHFTEDLNQVPREHRARARQPGSESDPRVQRYAAPAAPEPAPGRRLDSEIRVPFERSGTLMRVEAVVNGRHRVPFLIDTGASGVSLPAHVVAELGIPIRGDTPRVAVSTANGLVQVPLVELASIELGEARVDGLQATVNPSMRIGLLGGTFFNNFKYSVDAADGVITLVRNDGVRAGAVAEQWQERFGGLRDSIARLETHLATHELLPAGHRAELEANLAALKHELQELEIEANHARVPHAWRR